MNIECGDCSDFVELTERTFGKILDQFGFHPVQCESDHDGRECLLMAESERCRLLFVRSDGSDNCGLGSLGAEFPAGGFDSHADTGWYHVVTLLEFKSGKRLLTRRLLDKFLEGKESYFAWQADLLSKNVESLFDLFREGDEATWKDEFFRISKAQIKR
jgi:hypothetical protein